MKRILFLIFFVNIFNYSFSQNITADTILANQYFDLANKYVSYSMIDSAILFAQKAQAIYIKYFGEKSIKNANTLHLMGRLYYNKNNTLALECYFKALETRIELLGKNNLDVARTYNNIGIIYNGMGENDKALEYYFTALQIRKEILGEKNREVAMSYNNIGALYQGNRGYDKALEYNLKALIIFKEILGETHPDVATCYNNIGIVYQENGEYDKALEYSFKALQISKEIFGEKHPDVAKNYNSIGVIYKGKGEYDKALEYDFIALQIRKEILGEKDIDVAMSYNNIGIVYKDKGEYDKALEYNYKALQIIKEIFGENHFWVASSYGNIGTVYDIKGEHDKALEYDLKALQMFKEILGEKHPYVAMSYNIVGIIYNGKGEYDKALGYYIKALQLGKEIFGEKSLDVAESYNNIGIVFKDKGDYDRALENYFKALQIRKEILGEKHPLMAMSYNNIGLAYFDKDECDLALEYCQKGVASCLYDFNDTVNFYTTPTISRYLDWKYLLDGLQIKAKIFADISKTLTNLKYADRKNIALRHYQACDTLIDLARKGISTQSDKLALGEITSQVYKEAIDLMTSLQPTNDAEFVKNISDYDLNLAFYFSEKSKSSVLLEALAAQEAQKYAGIPDSLLQKEHSIKTSIAFYTKQLAEPEILDSAQAVLFQDRLFRANRSYDSLIMFFEKLYPMYHHLKYNDKPAIIKDIQALLDKKTAMISFFTGDSTITMFTLTKSNFIVQKVPKVKNLNDSIAWFRYGLTKTSIRMQENYRRLGFELCQQLIPQSVLNDKRINNLIIIPDGELAILPFESLLTTNYNGDINAYNDYPFLIKKYNVSYSYSANLFYLAFSTAPSSTIEITKLNDWLAFAPVFDDRGDNNQSMFSRELQKQLSMLKTDSSMINRSMFNRGYITPLPGTETETKAIFKLYDDKNFKAKVLLRDVATEESIKSGEPEQYKVLHFATHGFVNSEKPELSGLLLAQDTTGKEDGILYSGEIYNLKLNSNLVVLSACETGLGKIQKGEGLIGLTRALRYAGAKNIIVSLWEVADESTSDLMVSFYKNSLESNGALSYSEALRDAKLKMINQIKFAHPYFWSPFILIGK